MPRARKDAFPDLSAAERAVVGEETDYDWSNAVRVPRRTRPESVQFSLRLDEVLYREIQAIARSRGVTFSDVVRESLAMYVEGGGEFGLRNLQVSFTDQLMIQVPGGRAEPVGSLGGATTDQELNLPVPA